LGASAGAAVLVSLLTVFFAFLTCFLPLFAVLSVLCIVELVVVFCAFFAACGAAERKGTATTVNKVDVNSFFMMFSPPINVAVSDLNRTKSRQLFTFIWFFSLPLFCLFFRRSQLYFAPFPLPPPSPRIVILYPLFSGWSQTFLNETIGIVQQTDVINRHDF
jgi:hypothetical protein